jgi:hypothetical protein
MTGGTPGARAAMAAAWLLAAGVAPAVPAPAKSSPATQPAAGQPAATAERCLFIPPSLERSVVFYHSFERSAGRAEINRLGGRLVNAKPGRLATGLTGKGYAHARGTGALSLTKLAWPLHRPITVSLWWRLDEPMKPETCFHLASLRANGYVSHFVRGRGGWCALKEPTFVLQVYNFPGISNVNGIRFGSAWVPHGVWHHAAVVVSAGSNVAVYWDGRRRGDVVVKGRLFGAADVVRSVDLGPSWLFHPMTIDEVLILDRALSAGEVRAYVTAVRKLREMARPGGRPAGGPRVSAGPLTAPGQPPAPSRRTGRLRRGSGRSSAPRPAAPVTGRLPARPARSRGSGTT